MTKKDHAIPQRRDEQGIKDTDKLAIHTRPPATKQPRPEESTPNVKDTSTSTADVPRQPPPPDTPTKIADKGTQIDDADTEAAEDIVYGDQGAISGGAEENTPNIESTDTNVAKTSHPSPPEDLAKAADKWTQVDYENADLAGNADNTDQGTSDSDTEENRDNVYQDASAGTTEENTPNIENTNDPKFSHPPPPEDSAKAVD
jgi:hypothetical protein